MPRAHLLALPCSATGGIQKAVLPASWETLTPTGHGQLPRIRVPGAAGSGSLVKEPQALGSQLEKSRGSPIGGRRGGMLCVGWVWGRVHAGSLGPPDHRLNPSED